MTQGIFFNDFNNSYIPHILKELYIEKVYAPYLEGKKGLTMLDIGANVGLFSFYAKPYAKKIYAVEPSKEHFEIMQHMIAYNDIKNVIPLNCAISNKDGKAEFFHNTNVTMFSLEQAVNDGQGKSEKVKTKRLDTLFKEQKIDTVDFMKLDIEGSEADVICGEGFYNVKDRIKAMLVEYHVWSNRNPMQITTALMDFGFKVDRVPADATLFIATK